MQSSASDDTDRNQDTEYENICYICRRPEHTGKDDPYSRTISASARLYEDVRQHERKRFFHG